MSMTVYNKDVYVFSVFGFVKVMVHSFSNQNYGFHGDELLHLAAGRHLSWGYMEFPPLIGFISFLQQNIFGDSVIANRILPLLAGVFILYLTWLLVKELGGGLFAQSLALTCSLAAPGFLRTSTLLQPVIFDHVFWLLGFYFLNKYLSTTDRKFVVLMGIVAGLGFLTKYTTLFWVGSMILTIAISKHRLLFLKKETWIAAIIFLLIATPNIIWQFQHDFPIQGHLAVLYESQLNNLSNVDFFKDLIVSLNPFSLFIWLAGLIALLFSPKLTQYKLVGLSVLFSFVLLLASEGKFYYTFPLFSVLFSAGSVYLEGLKQKTVAKYALNVLLIFVIISGIIMLPHGTPILPLPSFVKYARIGLNELGRYEGLPDDYASMTGWPELVEATDEVFRSIPDTEKGDCIIWAKHYAQAGAILHLGKKLGLPDLVCYHGSFYLWAREKGNPSTSIAVGFESPEHLNRFYGKVEVAKTVRNEFAEEDDEISTYIYVCKNPKQSLSDRKTMFRNLIFD